ncbi:MULTISPECIES: UPF0146 family protein [Halomicrobium]|uniref:UPF0146 protein Hmuk_0306 n=2 Tax=Halomicrobium mukohataei TaxID=57705 RepID=C7NX78_HALMD|nr:MULTISPECIES: UPF0146 family protein [Halomicrobium]ACV46443.1 Protein of unknown function UPF0146 [Halomicrobium mukohataei DSM 12286]QCD64993.1 hypothetical protein E5139_04815 [Halomicrobium mukohataei]QFR19799.1 hypothetical protein GBQ70_04810 [Halomicrobium sp. ZPS1]
MNDPRSPLVDRLADFECVVEVGVGRRPDVARRLARRGVDVTVTDVVRRDVPRALAFVLDDVTDPDPSVYADAEAVYALNCPPELHRPLRALAREHGAVCYFTTLGGDQPAVAVDREQLPGGETLYRVRQDGPKGK